MIVTHNRRQLLAAAIDSVLQQSVPVARLIVVDNRSSDQTWEFLCGLDDRVTALRPPHNTGGAGGFARGIAWAVEVFGADLVWLMDDDAVADRLCLQVLLDAYACTPGLPFVAPMVTDSQGLPAARNRPFLSTEFFASIAAASDRQLAAVAASFVGPLIDARAAAATHAPLEDFFIWHDDTEYLARLAAARPGRFVPTALIHHVAVTAGPGEFVVGRARQSIRNLVWCLRDTSESALGVRAWADLLRVIVIGQFTRRGTRMRAARAVIGGVLAGVSGRPRHRGLAQVLHESRRCDELSGRVTGAD